jgi:tripartite-type tricarboxylate transporter receptor subunit TctC
MRGATAALRRYAGASGAGAFVAVAFVASVMLACAPARAADGADFYAGKTLTIFAGLPPGGGVDGEMRVLAQHLSKYIPGHPAIVARNMPGAGGIVLGNYINSVAAPDGLTLAMPGRSGFLLSNVVPQKGISYDLTKLSYVGGAGSAVNELWLNRKLGIASIADLKSRKPDIVIGALTARSENAIAPRVLAAYEGWPLKVVTGYGGFQEVLIAIERGEVDGLFTHEGSIANSRPDMIAAGTLKPVVQSFESLPDVPVLADVVASPDAKALLALVTTPSQIGLLSAAHGRCGLSGGCGTPGPAGRPPGRRDRAQGADRARPVVGAGARGQSLSGIYRAQGRRVISESATRR